MLFSIIIPVYNSCDFLKNAVESVARQEFDDCEIILVNDGSTDASPSLCEQIKNTYKNVTVIHQQNKGSAAARNTGINASHGEYLLFLDADDEYKDGVLNFLASVIATRKFDVCCFGYCNVNIIKNSKVYKSFFHRRCEQFYETKSQITKEILDIIDDRIVFSSCCTKAYRRELLIENKILMPQDVAIGEDFCFNLEVIKHSNSYYFTDEVFYEYISQNENSVMTRFNENKHSDLVKMHKYRNSFLSEYNNLDSKMLDTNIKMDYVRICYSAYMDMFLKKCSFNFSKKMDFISQTKNKVKYDYKETDKSFLSKKQAIIFSVFATQNNFFIYLSSLICFIMKYKLGKSF
ncbi:MAG: glycosyltransferase family 2 protein [Oscillospiraceae bacterium]